MAKETRIVRKKTNWPWRRKVLNRDDPAFGTELLDAEAKSGLSFCNLVFPKT